jgi:outer membrane cobalamin receptor
MITRIINTIIITIISANLLSAHEVETLAPSVIKGFVYDSISKQPLEYATVSLVRSDDKSLVTGTITDASGFFRISGIEPGSYAMDITFIGFQSKRTAVFSLREGQRTYDIGSIMLRSASESIDEVMIVHDRPTMSYHIDKKVINVSQHHTSSSGTAVEVLENIPSISVGIEGDVSLRGSSSFTVLIDGKPTIMDPNDVLNQIPASQIENIEIITNPSAKFDPDGVAGIINIVMKRNLMQGFSGVFNTSGGTHNRYGGDFLLNYRKERVNLYLGADYNQRSMTGESVNRNETYRSDTAYLYSTGDFDRNRYSWGARIGLEFNINPKNTLTFGYRLGDRERGSNSSLIYEEWNSSDIFSRNIFSSTEEGTRGGFSQNLTIDFRKEFDTKEHNLLAQFVWGNSDFEERSLNFLTNELNEITSGQRSSEIGPSNRFTLRLDYTLPVGSKSRFEAGYHGNLRNSEEQNSLYFYNTINGEFELNDLYSMLVDYSTNVHAVYSLIAGESGKFGYQFGLRSEYTDRLINLKAEEDEFPLKRWDFYPTAHFSYQYSDNQEVMTSYTRRLQRLRGWYLEPFYTWSDAYNLRIGNPNLIPEYIDSYELSYQRRFTKNVLSLDIYYRVTHNKIERIRSIYEDNDNIFLTTFANVGKDYSLGTEIMLGFDPLSWWHFDIMGNIYDYRQKGQFNNRDYSVSSFNWNARWNNTFRLATFTRLQLTGRYNSPTVSAQGERKGYLVTSIALKQDFFNNLLSLTLQVRDALGTMGHERTVRDTDFYSYSEWNPDTPIITLTATFRLNNYNTERRPNQQGDNEIDGMNGDL